jgi:hypothetical protein
VFSSLPKQAFLNNEHLRNMRSGSRQAHMKDPFRDAIYSQTIACSCDRTHHIEPHGVIYESGAPARLPEALSACARGPRAFLLMDARTREGLLGIFEYPGKIPIYPSSPAQAPLRGVSSLYGERCCGILANEERLSCNREATGGPL